jgi:hypothetical protein
MVHSIPDKSGKCFPDSVLSNEPCFTDLSQVASWIYSDENMLQEPGIEGGEEGGGRNEEGEMRREK